MNRSMLTLTLFALFAIACSQKVVQRDPREYDLEQARERGNAIENQDGSFDHFAPLRPKIGVLPLDSAVELASEGPKVAVEATKELIYEISRTQKFVVAQREAREAFPGGSSAVYTGNELRLEQTVRRAKDAGLTILLFGKVRRVVVRSKQDEVGLLRSTKSASMAEIDLRLLDVRAGKIIFEKVVRADTLDRQTSLFGDNDITPEYRIEMMIQATRNAVKKIVPDLVRASERLAWRGRVAKIVGTRLYINAGRETGIQIGDIMRVSSQGEDVYDPETGAYLGKATGAQKATLQIVDYFGQDGSVARLHSGGNVQEGDIVEIY